ncbi:MAG: enoyl-CoA hydratase/isomerase family protein [Burkholderiales bacterium]|nr:enoyl-CoA hydratase/isomerase family protein [Burkholderiales bacterium]
MTTSPELGVERRAGVLWLTIRREERRNALSPAVLAGLTEALAEAQGERGLRAIVLTGAGDQAFCAGADLQSGQSFAFDFSEPTGAFARLLRQARASHLPLVARVNGACMAGGMGLLAMCDLAVAAPHARFGLPEVKVGLFPAQVLAALQHLVPRRRLVELCITGEAIGSAEALEMGLVNHVDADLDGRLDWLLARIADKSPAAIRRGLYTLKAIETMDFEQSMAFTESQIALFAQTEDAKEGQAAFREKRKPEWTGH